MCPTCLKDITHFKVVGSIDVQLDLEYDNYGPDYIFIYQEDFPSYMQFWCPECGSMVTEDQRMAESILKEGYERAKLREEN